MCTLSNLGLILNAVGSVFAAVAFSEPEAGWMYHESDTGQRSKVLALTKPKLFWIGLACIAIGNLLQLKLG